jgi:hypothetical protein
VKEKIGCFSCGRTVNYGEHYICISRLRRARIGDGNDDIVDAMASLQVCIYCAARSQSDNITFYREVPLLELEKAGFYWFVKKLAGSAESWTLRVQEENCSLCDSLIMKSDYYTQIEICKETQKQDGHIEVLPESISGLAIICDVCAKRFMVWL